MPDLLTLPPSLDDPPHHCNTTATVAARPLEVTPGVPAESLLAHGDHLVKSSPLCCLADVTVGGTIPHTKEGESRAEGAVWPPAEAVNNAAVPASPWQQFVEQRQLEQHHHQQNPSYGQHQAHVPQQPQQLPRSRHLQEPAYGLEPAQGHGLTAWSARAGLHRQQLPGALSSLHRSSFHLMQPDGPLPHALGALSAHATLLESRGERECDMRKRRRAESAPDVRTPKHQALPQPPLNALQAAQPAGVIRMHSRLQASTVHAPAPTPVTRASSPAGHHAQKQRVPPLQPFVPQLLTAAQEQQCVAAEESGHGPAPVAPFRSMHAPPVQPATRRHGPGPSPHTASDLPAQQEMYVQQKQPGQGRQLQTERPQQPGRQWKQAPQQALGSHSSAVPNSALAVGGIHTDPASVPATRHAQGERRTHSTVPHALANPEHQSCSSNPVLPEATCTVPRECQMAGNLMPTCDPSIEQGRAQPPSDPSFQDSLVCKAFFDGLPVGLHLLTSTELVKRCCAAVSACRAVAVVLHNAKPVDCKNDIRHDLQMPPPHSSKEFQEYMLALSHKTGLTNKAQLAQPLQGVPEVHMTGLALSWCPDRAFYITTQMPALRRPVRTCPEILECWPSIVAALSSPAAKVIFAGKCVINALRQLACPAQLAAKLQPWLPPGGLSMDLAGPLADVRVAAGLLDPGHPFTADTSDKDERPHLLEGDPCGQIELLFNRVHLLAGWTAAFPDGAALQPPSSAALLLAPGQSDRIQANRVKDKLNVAREALFAMALHVQLQPALDANGLSPALALIEQPMVRVIADIEWNGMPVDPEAVDMQLAPLRAVQDELLLAWNVEARRAGIHKPMPPTGSNRQVKAFLWDKLALPPPPNAPVRPSIAAHEHGGSWFRMLDAFRLALV
jgi:hypothetical protein